MSDLGANVEEIAGGAITNSSELYQLKIDIDNTIVQEVTALAMQVSTGAKPSGPDYVGGHFNLILATPGILAALGGLESKDYASFGNSFSGVRQDAVYGNAAEGNYPLHSRQNGGNSGYYNLHFDTYDPTKDVVGAIGHLFGDVFAGHIGTPCLDPAWQQ